MNDQAAQLAEAMRELNENGVLDLTLRMIADGHDTFEIQSILNDGIKDVGKRFESGEYFLADLIVSGIIYQNAMELFHISDRGAGPVRGKVVIGVVENDIHDIGKNIVCEVLRAEGFEVIDLGVDVRPQAFVEAVRQHQPDVLALSGVMGFALDSMKATITQLEQRGLREGLAIIIGGSCITSGDPALIHADKMAIDPLETIAFCKAVTEKRNG